VLFVEVLAYERISQQGDHTSCVGSATPRSNLALGSSKVDLLVIAEGTKKETPRDHTSLLVDFALTNGFATFWWFKALGSWRGSNAEPSRSNGG